MKFEVDVEECRKAKVPHEIFLTNLIGNHILWFIASLGIVNQLWQPLALVPVLSVTILGYILWRTKKARRQDSWFVRCHWEMCAKRSKVFFSMLAILGAICILGWLGYTYLGMMDVAVKAMIGGMGVLPVMVTVLVLIVMESDALHQATEGKVPDGIVNRLPYPNNMVPVEEAVEGAVKS